jgi:hypothetical protein
MDGEVVYLYSYDVAREIDLKRAEASLRREEAGFLEVVTGKTAPREVPYHRPLLLRLPPTQVATTRGVLELRVELKAFSVGVLSISFLRPFLGATLADLVAAHRVETTAGQSLDELAEETVERALERIGPFRVSPARAAGRPEAYTVFCVTRTDEPAPDAARWLAEKRREVAALLTEEEDPGRLSERKLEEVLATRFSYYADDLVVLDWDAALVLEPDGSYQDLLFVIESVNAQLTELRFYDRVLDETLDRSYDELARYRRRPLARGLRKALARLRELRSDLTLVYEEIHNVTKFFGDYHLARVYGGCVQRFHVSEWQETVERKLRTLDGLYYAVHEDVNTRKMLALETVIVILFVLDLAGLALQALR